MNQKPNSRFKFFPQLNDIDEKCWINSKNTICPEITERFFASNSLQDTFLQALADNRVLAIKEVLESFELFARIRKSISSPMVADLCCGHGLLGILFAMFERKVHRVILADKFEPESCQHLLKTAIHVAPWIREKIKTEKGAIGINHPKLEPRCAIVSAHACGSLSDRCIDIAIANRGHLAILPCCYPKSACQAPRSLQTKFGLASAFDIDRTYRLQNAGYLVRWAEIPAAITPMNRVIYANYKTNGVTP